MLNDKKVKPINFIRGDSKELEFGRIPFNIRILDDMIAGGYQENILLL